MNGLAPLNTRVPLLSARPRPWLPFTLLGLLVLLLFLDTPLTARADSAALSQASSMTSAQAPCVPLVAGIWDLRNNLSHPSLASRRVMLQIGVVGMCIALYIIIWRK